MADFEDDDEMLKSLAMPGVVRAMTPAQRRRAAEYVRKQMAGESSPDEVRKALGDDVRQARLLAGVVKDAAAWWDAQAPGEKLEAMARRRMAETGETHGAAFIGAYDSAEGRALRKSAR